MKLQKDNWREKLKSELEKLKPEEIPWWIKYAAVVVLIFLLLIIDALLVRSAPAKDFKAFKLDWWDVGFAFVNAVIPSLVAYLMASIFLRFSETKAREEELNKVVVVPLRKAIQDDHCAIFSEPKKIMWEKLFDGAQEVYLLTQSWPNLHNAIQGCLPNFLNRGGKIYLMLHAQNAKANEFAAERLEQGANMNQKISATVDNLKKLIADNHKQPDDCLKVKHTERMNWYCGIYSKPNNQLLLSLYAHRHHDDRPPSFLIAKSDEHDLVEWFEREWDSLLPENASADWKLNS